MSLDRLETIEVVPLFPELGDALLTLLESLETDDWLRPAVGSWTVRDVAAHLLDGDLRRLSFQRDQQLPPSAAEQITGYTTLVNHLNRLNAEWVTAFARLSPRVLIDLLGWSGPQVQELFERLEPEGEAMFAVSWAGQTTSPHWFDLAREYTEKWHHQQQIRDAVGQPGMCQERWLAPVIDAFVRALPHRYSETMAKDGEAIVFTVTGEAGGTWTLKRSGDAWQLWRGTQEDSRAQLELSADTTWRFMTKGLTPEAARARTQIGGDPDLARPFFDILAVMA